MDELTIWNTPGSGVEESIYIDIRNYSLTHLMLGIEHRRWGPKG